MREDVIARISKVVETLWPSVQLRVFGSCATDIYLPTSDIDLCIMGANACSPSPIDELASALRRRSMGRYNTQFARVALHFVIGALTLVCAECASAFRRVQAIATARVPIIKLVDAATGCLVDISFDVPTGPAHINLIKVCPFSHPHAARPHTPHSHSRTTRQLCTIASYSLRSSLAAANALSSVNLFGWLMIGGAGEHSRLVGPHTPLLWGGGCRPTRTHHRPPYPSLGHISEMEKRNPISQFSLRVSLRRRHATVITTARGHMAHSRESGPCVVCGGGVRVCARLRAREICFVVPSE